MSWKSDIALKWNKKIVYKSLKGFTAFITVFIIISVIVANLLEIFCWLEHVCIISDPHCLASIHAVHMRVMRAQLTLIIWEMDAIIYSFRKIDYLFSNFSMDRIILGKKNVTFPMLKVNCASI